MRILQVAHAWPLWLRLGCGVLFVLAGSLLASSTRLPVGSEFNLYLVPIFLSSLLFGLPVAVATWLLSFAVAYYYLIPPAIQFPNPVPQGFCTDHRLFLFGSFGAGYSSPGPGVVSGVSAKLGWVLSIQRAGGGHAAVIEPGYLKARLNPWRGRYWGRFVTIFALIFLLIRRGTYYEEKNAGCYFQPTTQERKRSHPEEFVGDALRDAITSYAVCGAN